MKKRLLATGLVAALALIGLPSVAQAAQTVSVDLSGSCEDGVMDEVEDDDDCVMTVTFKPATPARVVTFNYLKSKKWTRLKSVTTKGGVAKWDVSAYDADDMWLDGTYSYRAQSVKRGKEKAYTGKTITIKYIADATEEDGEEASSIYDGKKTTNTTAKTTQSTVPHGSAAPVTVAPTTTLASSTMTMPTVAESNWYTPVRSASDFSSSGRCMPSPGANVPASVCSALQSNKTKSEMTTVLAGISNIYIRTDFCQWVFGFMDKASLTDARTKCSQVNAAA